MKKMIAFALVALMAMPLAASAQTMAVSFGAPGVQFGDVIVGTPFNIVVWGDTAGNDAAAAEFVVTELLLEAPGVFKLGTTKINGTTLDLGDNSLGEYILAFGDCFVPSSELVLVTVNYGDFGGSIGADQEMGLRGFQPGDTRPSSFNGEVGFVKCDNAKYAASVGGQDGGFTGSGLVFEDGHCVLNPTPAVVDNEAASMGQVKARF